MPEYSSRFPQGRPVDHGLVRGADCLGVPHTLSGRSHGDPFPLPLPGSCGLQSPTMPGKSVSAAFGRQVGEALKSLNALDAPTSALASFAPPLPATLPQLSVINRVAARVARQGVPPPDLDGAAALRELLKSKDLYTAAPCNVKTYVAANFKVLHNAVPARPLRDRLPPVGRHIMDHASEFICRSPKELDELVDSGDMAPVYPYWDVVIASNRAKRMDLFKRLMHVGLVGFRRRIQARASLFFVGKKDGSLRLVVDGREASSLHRRPPHASLGSATAVSAIDFTSAGSRRSVSAWGASADLLQGFYQMTWKRMGSWFGFDFPASAEDFGVSAIYDESLDRYVEVDPSTMLFPCYEGLPPGWSWSLFFCNMVTADAMAVGVSRALGIPSSRVCFAEERMPAPRLSDHKVVCACYVDNGNIVGSDKAVVNKALSGFLEELDHRKLVAHEIVHASPRFECGGALFDFDIAWCSPKPRRVWRLYKSIGELLRIGGATGDAVRVIAGHIVHLFMLLRPALASLHLIYRFINQFGSEFASFSQPLRRELRTIRGLILLVGVDLALPWCEVAFCSDACPSGYAVSEARLPVATVSKIAAVREKWRFKQLTDQVLISHVADRLGQPCHFGAAGTLADFAAAAGPPPASSGASLCQRFGPRAIEEAGPVVVPLPDDVLDENRWKLVVKGSFMYDEPIHMLEGRTTLVGLKRMTRSADRHGYRFLSIGDNLSSLIALEKGRAQNFALLGLTRTAAARQIACDLRQFHRYSESKRNPTDFDSRAVERGDIVRGQTVHGAGVRWAPPIPSVIPRGPRFRAQLQLDRLVHHSFRPFDSPHSHSQIAASSALSHSNCSVAPPPSSLHADCSVAPPPPVPLASLLPRRIRKRKSRAVLEIFAGTARLSGACRFLGLHVAAPIELVRGEWCDLSDPRVVAVIKLWIRQRRVWYVHFATPCTPWSVATARSAAQHHLQEGLQTAHVTLQLLDLCHRCRVHWSVENPHSSALWRWAPLATFFTKTKSTSVTIDCCQYGCRYRKTTRIQTSIHKLSSLAARCNSSHTHEVLQGTVMVHRPDHPPKCFWKTRLASPYPPMLCDAWARILLEVAPLAARADGHPLGPQDRDSARHGGPLVHPDWERALIRAAFPGPRHPEGRQAPPPVPEPWHPRRAPLDSPPEWWCEQLAWGDKRKFEYPVSFFSSPRAYRKAHTAWEREIGLAKGQAPLRTPAEGWSARLRRPALPPAQEGPARHEAGLRSRPRRVQGLGGGEQGRDPLAGPEGPGHESLRPHAVLSRRGHLRRQDRALRDHVRRCVESEGSARVCDSSQGARGFRSRVARRAARSLPMGGSGCDRRFLG